MDNNTIERELINLLKMTSEQFAVIRTKHESCTANVNKELDELKTLIKLKFDKEDGDKLIKEIDKIKKILKVDNSENVGRNFSIMNSVINYITYTIAIISILSGVIVGILKITGVF